MKPHYQRHTLTTDQTATIYRSLRSTRLEHLQIEADEGLLNDRAQYAAATVKRCDELLQLLRMADATVYVDAPVLWQDHEHEQDHEHNG